MPINNLNEKQIYTPLKRFIDLVGIDRDRLTNKRKYEIAKSKRYKQWKKLYLTAKMAARINNNQLEEVTKLDVGEYSKKYKHIHPEIKKSISKVLAAYSSKGYSKNIEPVKSKIYGNPITKKGKLSKRKIRVGKLAYRPLDSRKVHLVKFIDPYKIGKKTEVRIPKMHSYISGSQVKEDINTKETKINKILNKNKKINKEIKLNKSGDSLVLNPEM